LKKLKKNRKIEIKFFIEEIDEWNEKLVMEKIEIWKEAYSRERIETLKQKSSVEEKEGILCNVTV